MVRPMVHSTKHIVQTSITTDTLGTVNTTSLVNAVAVGAKTVPAEIEEGNSVKAIFIEYWIKSSSTNGLASGQWCVFKRVGDSTDPSTTDMAALDDWDNKKNILKMGMGLYNDSGADATPIIREWIKIPKSKQRMGLGDKIRISFFNPAVSTNRCGFATYKEYS